MPSRILIAFVLQLAAAGGEPAGGGSVVLLDFEDDAQLASLGHSPATTVVATSEASKEGHRSAKVHYAAVPEGVREYPAVVVAVDALPLHDFSRYEAITFWVFNPGETDAELSLSVWDEAGRRSFPIPSTVVIPPDRWQRVVSRLVLQGLDATKIGSIHFYQKVNRKPYTLLIDDVGLLSPQAGRVQAKVQVAGESLSRARTGAAAIGAEAQVEPVIASLSQRLERLKEPTGNRGSERTQYLLELARVTTEAEQLADSLGINREGTSLRLTGPLPEAGWLSNREKIRGLIQVRLFDTSMGDEVFDYLAPAQDLEVLLAGGGDRRISGAGLEKLSSTKLRRLGLSSTAVRDDALTGLKRFRALEDLALNDNRITSAVFKHFEGLENLRALRLDGTGVSDAGFSEISKFTRLDSLNLERTQVTGNSLVHLKNLTRLTELNLNHTRIDDVGLTHLGGLLKLETLRLEGTPITGASFSRIGHLERLSLLNLNHTRVGDSAIRQLGGLANLKRLELSSTRITDASVGHVAGSARLNYLDLYGTNITDAGLAHLKSQTGLEQLYLGGTQVSDAGVGSLKELTELRQLDLGGTRVTDAALAHLQGMTKLVTLKLAGTRITGEGLGYLAGLSSLRVLDLSGTSVTDDALSALARLENLRSLYLSGTHVTSEGMQALRPAGALVELHLDATEVGDEGLEALTGLANLQVLNLNETSVTDQGLNYLEQMNRLQSLSLNQTRITDHGLGYLGDGYTTLELTHTRITDQGVEQLQRNDQLEHLRLASTAITNNALKLLQATPNLRQLDLAETNVNDAGLEHLAALPELAVLNLNNTAVSDLGLDTLLEMPSLGRVSLENARVTSQGASYLKHRRPELDLELVFPWVWGESWSHYSLPETTEKPEPPATSQALLVQLKDLTGLGYLHAGESLLTPAVLRSLKDLPSLEHLSFQGTRITDQVLADLLGLSQVARLDLADTPITDASLIHLKDMQGLRELNLEGTRITGGGLIHLANLTRLQALNVGRTPLTDDGLEHLVKLPGLRRLELSDTPITDRGIESLSELSKLQYLDLYGTRLSDAGLAYLSRLTSLRYCYLTNTAITDTGIRHLRTLSNLEELALDGTQLTDRGLAVIGGLSSLRRLRIGRTRVTDAGLNSIAGLANLNRLELDDLPLTDASVATLQGPTQLRVVDLSGTRVTADSLGTLARLPLLAELNLQDTSISAEAAARFQQENPKIKVAFGTTQFGYSIWSLGITFLYAVVVLSICFYGIHRYWLVWLLLRDKDARTSRSSVDRFAELPTVTVQLPMFNERHVAASIIEAACALDYPGERLQIQVLDDSTDESADIARRCCASLASAGHRVEYLHRSNREGFKGGALAAGLESAVGEFVAVFDADFVPPPDILQQLIHYFVDPQVGMVQAEWAHLNRDESLLTECQAMFLDGHFVVEQTTRSRNHRWFNFNGTAGIWRKRCIEDAGGWQHDTLTEDTDLSYRAQLMGWRFVYLPTVRCAAELPSTVTAFLGQQHRWTKGLIQTAKKLYPVILRSRAPWTVKLEAWFHLTSPVMYLVMFVLTAIAMPAIFLATPFAERQFLALAVGVATLGMGTFGAAMFYVVSQRAQGLPLGRTVLRLPALMALGIGISAVNARAVLEALLGYRSPFVRTPKFGGRADCDFEPSPSRRGWRVPAGILELVMAGVLFACLAMSFLRPYTLIGAPFLLLFALGYSGVGFSGLLDRPVTRRPPHPALSHRERGWREGRQQLRLARVAVGTLGVLFLACVSAATLALTSAGDIFAKHETREPISLGVNLTTADWRMIGGRGGEAEIDSAIKRVYVDRGSLVLNVQLDEQTEQGEIVLDLDGAMRPLGNSMRFGRQLTFDVDYPSRFTGEFQAFVKDRRDRSQYGSIEFVESHDAVRSVTASLIPGPRAAPMGYQDEGFDPEQGIGRIGLKISAQSDRVRGEGYRSFRGTIRIAKVRIADVERDAHPEPEIRPVPKDQLRPAAPVTPEEFLAASGVDRPWPIGYGFSGPVTAAHLEELERTYASMARLGVGFTRVYVGDYRTGLVFDGEGKLAGVEPAFLEYVDRLAEVANRHRITVMFSLTDNTMADGRGLEGIEYLEDGEDSERFVENVLSQFVRRLEGRHVIWDVFNEPENVTALPLRIIQRYVDRVLAAGRRADPHARFTVVSRSRPEIVYWQGRGLDVYSHNVFTDRSLEEAFAAPRVLDRPIMVAEIAPELVSRKNLESLRDAGYTGVGIWGWGTDDKYSWSLSELDEIAEPLMRTGGR